MGKLWAFVLVSACSTAPTTAPTPAPAPTRTETLEVAHSTGGQIYTVSFLPDASGHTFVTASGEVLNAARPVTARVALSGGGLTRKDHIPVVGILRDACLSRSEFACRALARDNGGPIFVNGRWLFQFDRTAGGTT